MASQALLVFCLDFSSSLLSILALFFPSHPCSFIPCHPLLPSFVPVSNFLHASTFVLLSCAILPLQLLFFTIPMFFFLPNTFLWPCVSYPIAPLFFSKSFTSCQSTLFPHLWILYVILMSFFLITHPSPPRTHKHIIFTSRCKPFLPPSICSFLPSPSLTPLFLTSHTFFLPHQSHPFLSPSLLLFLPFSLSAPPPSSPLSRTDRKEVCNETAISSTLPKLTWNEWSH